MLGDYFVSKHLQKLKCDNHNSKVFYITDSKNPQKIFTKQPNFILSPTLIEKINFNLIESWSLPYTFQDINNKKRKLIEDHGFTFPFISKTYSDLGNKNNILYIGNSTAIRSFDYYIPTRVASEQIIMTNRGVSGIEGFVSSSTGASIGTENLDLFIGDISFIHDLNALFNLHKVRNSIRIFILNNQGGGIFKNLPLKGFEGSMDLLTTPHDFNFEAYVKMQALNILKFKTK